MTVFVVSQPDAPRTSKSDAATQSSSPYDASVVYADIQRESFMCDGTKIAIAKMTEKDYAKARQLLPKVSRCAVELSEEEVRSLLAVPTYHPYCAFREDTGELVGFAEIHRMPHLGRNFDGRLERVVVAEEFRNRGLASLLCEHIVHQAHTMLGCGRLDLTVEKPAARHIYEQKLGFEEVKTTVMRRIFKPDEIILPVPRASE